MATHTETALAVARETGWNLDDCATANGWAAIGLGPVGQHRDSDALARSNFDVITRDLSEAGARFEVHSFGHWAVGWVEEIAYDAGDAETVQVVQEWRDALADYPVADDEHFSELEYEELAEYIGSEFDVALAGAVLDAIMDAGQASNVEDLGARDLERAALDVLESTASECAAYSLAAYAGDGHLDVFGGIVELPGRPDAALIDALADYFEESDAPAVEELRAYRSAALLSV